MWFSFKGPALLNKGITSANFSSSGNMPLSKESMISVNSFK